MKGINSTYCFYFSSNIFSSFQALKCDLIDFLLQTLQRGLPVTVREPGQCRAYIVKALKAMQKNPLYGMQVGAVALSLFFF